MKDDSVQLRSGSPAGIPRARARFLTQAIQLEETDAPGLVGVGVFLAALLVGGVIMWSAITELSEVSRSPGEVVPAGLINRVQHLEGGIVRDIHVRNGDRVKVGALLVSLAPSATRSEFDQLQARQASLAPPASKHLNPP